MQTERVLYYPVQFIVLHPLVPVAISTVLPGHIRRITGIKAIHSSGVEKMTEEDFLPVIGHLSLEFNNRAYHFGHMDIAFDHSPDASDGFLETTIDVYSNALVTGNYENKVFTALLNADGTVAKEWSNYIVTVYLRSLGHD